MTDTVSTPPSGDYKDAKAQAKAAKAYAKAQRPWFKKKRYLALIAVAAIIGISVATSGGGGDNTTASPAANTAPQTTTDDSAADDTAADDTADDSTVAEDPAPAVEQPTGKLPLVDGDWRLDSLKVKSESYGNDFTGRARISYVGDDPDGGDNCFTITVFKGANNDVATLDGCANTVKAGSAVTVDLFSTDKFVKGPYTYDFQNSF